MTKYKNPRARSKSTFSIFSSFGFSGWAIIVLLLVIGVFLGSFFWEAPSPKVERSLKPPQSVTLQVLNGCGDNGAAQRLADAMMPGDSLQVYDVIEKGDTKLADLRERPPWSTGAGRPQAMAKSRTRPAAWPTGSGSMSPDVILLRLEENILNIDVTVIAGKDYGAYVAKFKETKEASL